MSMLDQWLERMSGVKAEPRPSDVPPVPVTVSAKLPEAPSPVKVPRRAKAADRGSYLSRPDTELVRFSPEDAWTIEDACAGTHIVGANGSGKTKGSGQTIAKAFLRAGFGGLVLCAKPDEKDNWIAYAKACGREKHLIIVSEDGPWRFNLFAHEFARAGNTGNRVDNLVTILMNLVSQTGRRSGGEESFWQQAGEQLLRNALMILAASSRQFSLLDLQRFIDGIPRDLKAVESEAFKSSDVAKRLEDARLAYEAAGRSADYDAIKHYLTVQFPGLADRTRSSVTFTLSAMLQDLLVGTLRELFATGTNYVPEDTFEGAIIILDLPASINRVHATAQTLFKITWQMAALRRMETANNDTRPCFCWCDESHCFVSDMDARFQSLARAARVATVFLTQNLSAYRSVIGGQHADNVTKWLLGLFQTHIFHALSDPDTMEHAQRLFGKRLVERINVNGSDTAGGNYSYTWGSSASGGYSSSQQVGHGTSNTGWGWNASEQRGRNHSRSEGFSTTTTMEHVLEAHHLTSLSSGSDQVQKDKRHLKGIAQAYIFRVGRTWSTSTTELLAHFDRRLA